ASHVRSAPAGRRARRRAAPDRRRANRSPSSGRGRRPLAPTSPPGGQDQRMLPEIVEVLFTRDQIQSRVVDLAREITRDYNQSQLVLVSILRGSVFFATDLARHIDLPLSMDFLSISSYGEDSEGVVRITKDLEENIAGKDVLVIEDIIDTGFTLKYLLRTLGSRNPKSLEVCALLVRRARRIIEMDLRYIGFEIPDKFVVGYGLDYKQKYRNLPYIGVVKP